MEGFTFQYSPSLQDEVETTLNTLLPLLHQYYPKADVADNFQSAVVDKCRSMIWDEEKQMIIDTMAPDETEEIETEENLLGFVFDMGGTDEQLITRPSNPTFQPHDEDSVSTLRSNDNTIRSAANFAYLQ